MTKTYAQLTREIEALKAVAERQLAMEVKGAVAKINEVIAKYELTAADLTFKRATESAKKKAMVKPAGTPSTPSSAPPFSDGKGHTWGGRGPRPQWLRDAMERGQTLESFATSGATAVVAAGRPSPVKAKQAGIKIPAKYRDSTTGDTWSGRGSQPRWLKQALRRRGATLADFVIGTPSAPTEQNANLKRPASKRAASAKTPKPAAKKASAKKSPNQVVATKSKARSAAKKTMAIAKKRTVLPPPPVKKTRKSAGEPSVAAPSADAVATAAAS